jgi:hypothetical protein
MQNKDIHMDSESINSTNIPVMQPQPAVNISQIATPQPQKSMVLPIVITVIITSLVLVAGFFGYQYFQMKKQNATLTEPAPTVLPTTQPTSLTNSVPVDWKTYTNTKYIYQFKYPQNWEINPYSNGGPPKLTDKQLAQSQYMSVFDPQTFKIDNGDSIVFFPEHGFPDPNSSVIKIIPIICHDNITSDSCIKQIFTYPNPVFTIDTFTPYPAIRVKNQGPLSINVYLLHNSKIFSITLMIGNENRQEQATKILNQILSTFKFTDSTTEVPQSISTFYAAINSYFKSNIAIIPEKQFYSSQGMIDKPSWKLDITRVNKEKGLVSNVFINQFKMKTGPGGGGMGGASIDEYVNDNLDCYNSNGYTGNGGPETWNDSNAYSNISCVER